MKVNIALNLNFHVCMFKRNKLPNRIMLIMVFAGKKVCNEMKQS